MPLYSGPAPSPQAAFNFAGFVDVSFLRAQAARLLEKRPEQTGLDAGAVTAWLRNLAYMHHTYLRTYFYEAEFEEDVRRREQKAYLDAIADSEGAHLRLGHLIERKGTLQQKGVDALLVLDLLSLAHAGAYSSAIVVAGDRDFAAVVRTVQQMGTRVAIAAPAGAGVAKELRQLADRLYWIPSDQVEKMTAGTPPPAGPRMLDE